MKVARGRLWQPEIGMEHASRGRRSGNKGVGARWRGRFRIFSARHCSRTKVSHAENSGMTMLFFSWRLLRCRRGILSHPRERMARGGWFLFFLWGLLRCRGEWEREHEGDLIRCAGRPQEWSFGAVPPQERWHEGGWFLFFSLEVAPVSEGDFTPSGETARGGFDFLFCGGALLPFVLRVVAGACVGRWTGQPRMPPRERQHEGLGGWGIGGLFHTPKSGRGCQGVNGG